MPKTNYIEADVVKNTLQGQMELDLPNITYDELPCVSVLTITYKRKHFFQLMWNNWNNYKYPKDKIEWVIIDDSPDKSDDLSDLIPQYPNIRYIRCSEHMSVGKKRNYGVEQCRYDYIVHQDDDDYYFPDSILAKVRILKRYPKCGCCFSNSLAAYNVMNNISYMMDPQKPESCESLPEATMMYKRSFWEQQPFPSDHFGEGKGFVIGREKKFVSIPCIFNMISFTHSRNMTGLARSVETKSIKSDASKLANYYDLFDGVVKNIIRKIARLTNQDLKPTQYNRVFCYNQYGVETECTGDTCTTKNLGQKEFDILVKTQKNWIPINSYDDLDKYNTIDTIDSNDLILVCMYGMDLMHINQYISNDQSQNNDKIGYDANNLLQHERSKLLIYNSWECRDFLDPYKKGELCKYCLNHLKVPLDKVIIATTDFLNPLIHSFSPQVIGYDFPYLYAKANFKKSDIQNPSCQNRKKALCMFTRRGSIERTAVALFLHSFHKEKVAMTYLTIDNYEEADIKKYGVICSKYNEFKSLLPIIASKPPPKSTQSTILEIMQETSQITNNKLTNQLDNQFDQPIKFDKAAAKVYDTPMAMVNWELQDDIRHMVSESFIMLTMETNAEGYQSHCQQVSEKTYKAIKMGMPFINFTAKPGILKHLRSLGFKTFNPIINEEYDYPTIQQRTEDNAILQKQYYDRFRKLLKELNRICKLSNSDLIDLWEKCQPIVQHNLTVLESYETEYIKSIPIVEK